jgi:hypothetical protein
MVGKSVVSIVLSAGFDAVCATEAEAVRRKRAVILMVAG